MAARANGNGDMARLVFHVGMNRTGSSAIQTSLRSWSAGGFIYPQLGEAPYKPCHEDGLDQVFSEQRFGRGASDQAHGETSLADHELRRRQLAIDGKEKIRRAAVDAGDGTVILSGEGAYRYLKVSDLTALKRFTDELFDQVLMIGYIRPPSELISSTFHNAVVGHRLARFEQKYVPYRGFRKFDEVFGSDSVNLYKYDRRDFPDGDVVQHFCQVTGLPRITAGEVNTTSSRAALAAIYRLNKLAERDHRHGGAHRMLVKHIRRAFPHQDWPKFRLSPHLVIPLIETNADDLRWIEERIQRSLHSISDPKEHDVACEDDLLTLEPKASKHLRSLTVKFSDDARELMEQAIAA